jgi:hypothetical protein
MSRLLERLLLWVADVLDRNLVTVPDVDELEASRRTEIPNNSSTFERVK